MSEPTALYRHFAADGTLLYVGISLCAVGRLAQHRQSAQWYRDIARVDVEWLPTREAALAAELDAIRGERPLHNIVGAGRWSEQKKKPIVSYPEARTPVNPDRSWPIPASRALIAWGFDGSRSSLSDEIPAVAVGHLLSWDTEHKIPDWTRRYEFTGGASEVARREVEGEEARSAVLRDYYLLTYTYGIDPYVVHTAFLNIKEYQELIKAMGCGPDIGEIGHDPECGYGRSTDQILPLLQIERFWHSVHVFPQAAIEAAA